MPIYKGNKKIKEIRLGGRLIDKVYKGSTLVFDYVPPQPTNPTFTTLAQIGVNGDLTYKITKKGYYYFYCVNHYSDGRRWGQAYVNGTMVKQWNDWTDDRIGPYYLKPGDTIRMVTWEKSWTMTIYFQEGK